MTSRARLSLRLQLACLLFSMPLSAQLPPDQALASLQVAPGLQVELFAAEPQVINPTCFDIDPQGRLWVCEGVNYRARANPPFRKTGDRIVILEDAGGDGRSDRSTVFYENPGMAAPLGICHLGDRILVSQSPKIISIRIGADGKAGEVRDFLTGFDGANHDHGVHSFVLGPDGLLYGAFGNSGGQVTGPDGRRVASDGKPNFGGMVFRCRLDGTGLEVLAHNFRNNYECALNSAGDIFQSDNDDDGNQWVRFVQVFPGGNYGYLGKTGRHWSEEGKTHWHMEDPGVMPILARTGAGSPTGLCVYEGSLLPEMYRGMPIHCDAGPRVVQCFRLKPVGAGYHVDEVPLDPSGRQSIDGLSAIVKPHAILGSSDSWFRPSDAAVGPDGSLFVSDWYDPGVGGHGMGDTTRGRIYRVTPAGFSGYHAPKFDLESAAGLRQALSSPALSTRSQAVLKILALKEKALPILESWLADATGDLRTRIAWLLGPTPAGKAFFERLLADPAPGTRLLGLRCLKLHFPGEFAERAAALRLASDADPGVRRELLLLLRDVEGKTCLQLLDQLIRRHDGADRVYLEAIGIACRGREERVFSALAPDLASGEWGPKTRDLLLMFQTRKAGEILAARLARPGAPEAERREVALTLARLESRESADAIIGLLSADQPIELKRTIAGLVEGGLEGKWRHLKEKNGERLLPAAASLLKTPGLEKEGAAIAARGQLQGLKPTLAALAENPRGSDAGRAAAVEALGSFNDAADLPLLIRIAASPPPLSGHAIAAIGRMSGSEPQDALRRLLLESDSSEARSAAIRALGRSRPGGLLILQLASEEQIPEALRSLAGTLVHSSAFEEVRLMAGKYFPRPRSNAAEAVPPVSELIRRTGKPAGGNKVFFDEGKGNCGRCHRIRKRGNEVGPDLTAIGVKLGKEGLYEAILSPSAAISFEYKPWILQTRSAGLVTGTIVDETEAQVTLRDANGTRLTFKKKDIISRKASDISLMPEGLVGSMKVDDLVDLVEYLGQLKPSEGAAQSLSIADWMLIGPFPNPDDRGLDEAYPPEKSIDLEARVQGRDAAIGWKKVAANGEGYVDLMRLLEGSERSVAYLYTALKSPAEQETLLRIGSDDGVKVWLNGKLVHDHHTHRAAAPDQDQVRVRLQAGKNQLLFKVDNGDGASGLYLTVEAPQAIQAQVP